jgi:hypothetical protein
MSVSFEEIKKQSFRKTERKMDFPTQSKKNQITPNRKWQLI